MKRNFDRIWIAMEKPVVKRAPGHYLLTYTMVYTKVYVTPDPYITKWWMVALIVSTSQALCEGIPLVTNRLPSQKFCDMDLLCFLCCLNKLVVSDDLMHHCNILAFLCFQFIVNSCNLLTHICQGWFTGTYNDMHKSQWNNQIMPSGSTAKPEPMGGSSPMASCAIIRHN